MSSSYLLDPFVMQLIVEKNIKLLDLACGRGKWGYLIKTSHKPPEYSVGADIYLPYLKFVKDHKIYNDVVQCDIKYLPFRNDFFDLVLLFEVLEHTVKKSGSTMIDEAERVSAFRTTISTPNVRIEQEELDGNKYQRHVSLWTAKELRKKGYLVRGVGFGLFGVKPKLVVGLLNLAYLIPQLSYLLLALKDKKPLDTSS